MRQNLLAVVFASLLAGHATGQDRNTIEARPRLDRDENRTTDRPRLDRAVRDARGRVDEDRLDPREEPVLFAPAKTAGLYLRASVGFVGFDDAELIREGEPTADLEFDGGVAVYGAVGYDFPGLLYGKDRGRDEFTINLRAEAEGSWEQGEGDDFDANEGTVIDDVDLDAYGGAINVYVDFDIGGPLTVYLGVGVGGVIVETENNEFEGSDTAAVFQTLLGLEYEFNPNWALYGGVRARTYSQIDIGAAEVEELDSGAFEFGVKYTF